jgi:hypothetical protein
MDQHESTVESTEVPVACTLTDDEMEVHGREIEQTLGGRLEARPLPDGFALRFPGDDAWASRLLGLIAAERACCPFFTFELVFEPLQGPIWLHLRGPAGTNEFVAAMLA